MITDLNKVIVINKLGKQISLEQWQKEYGLQPGSTQLSKYFDLKESRFQEDIRLYGDVVINEVLFRVLDQFREDVGRPLTINSLNRNIAKQRELTNDGFRTASNSPHEVKRNRWGITGGVAADIDTSSHEQTNAEVLILIRSARKLGFKIRIGWKEYQVPSVKSPNGMTFIHVDVAPEYYSQGKPWGGMMVPVAWTREARW